TEVVADLPGTRAEVVDAVADAHEVAAVDDARIGRPQPVVGRIDDTRRDRGGNRPGTAFACGGRGSGGDIGAGAATFDQASGRAAFTALWQRSEQAPGDAPGAVGEQQVLGRIAAWSAARSAVARLPARASSARPKFRPPGRCAVQRKASALPSGSRSRIGPQVVSSTARVTGAAPATSIVSRCTVTGVHDGVARPRAQGCTRFQSVVST